MEKVMDQIVNDESKEDGGVETHEQLLDDIEKEFGESKSIASENRSKKSASRPGTSAKERKDDEVKSVKSRKLFEEEKSDNGKLFSGWMSNLFVIKEKSSYFEIYYAYLYIFDIIILDLIW